MAPRFLILAHRADRGAEAVRRLLASAAAAPGDVALVHPDELVLGPDWSLELPRTGAPLVTVPGSTVRADRLGAVFNRLGVLPAGHMAAGRTEDAEYARSELHAFALAWLASLPCPVVNPPRPPHLAGPGWSLPEQLAAAAREGVPTRRYAFTATGRIPTQGLARFADPDGQVPAPDPLPGRVPGHWLEVAGGAPRTVLVAGDRVLGDLPPAVGDRCRRLARAWSCPLLELTFIERGGDGTAAGSRWVLASADPRPSLAGPGEAAAVADLLLRLGRRPSRPDPPPRAPRAGPASTGTRPRVLLCGIPSESPLRLVREACRELGVPVVVFNQRTAHHYDLELEVAPGGWRGELNISGERWDLADFSGVYPRLMEPAWLPENRAAGRRAPDPRVVVRSMAIHEALNQWLDHALCRVLNRNGPSSSNFSKPYQARLIQDAGFLVPASVVTNDPARARRFADAHRRVIYKSISSARSIVRELTPPDRRRLGRIRLLPTQFQERVDGVDIRVHVVGDALFATRIRSAAVDYRYAGRDGEDVVMEPVELPPAVAARCLVLSRRLGLPLAGIDLRETPDGETYCFEVNPTPAFSYYQEYTGQPIARAIARYLAGGPVGGRAGAHEEERVAAGT